MRSLIRLFSRQVVLVNLLFLLLTIMGIHALGVMPVEEFPNVSFDKVVIRTLFWGASPEEVESLVTKRIEEKIAEVRGIDFIQSDSSQDLSKILVKFEDDIPDFDRAYRDLESQVNKVTTLPEGAEEPELVKLNVEEMNPVIHIVCGWDKEQPFSEGSLKAVAEDLALELEEIAGVRKVKRQGMRDREIRVLIDPDQAAGHGLTVGEIARLLRAENLNLPGGNLEVGGGERELLVRTTGEWDRPEEILDTVLIARPDGSALRLRELGRIEADWERAKVITKFKGQRAITLAIVKKTEGNALDIVDAVKRRIADFEETRKPDPVVFSYTADTTVRIRNRMRVLSENILVGLGLVFIVLTIVVGLRSSILAIIGVMFSFLVAMVILFWAGHSINVITLFSLVLVGGMLVDDAIIILENVHRHFEKGTPLKQAVVDGASEVALPVFTSTCTTVAAFLPLLLMTGPTGKFFMVIPLTVTFALVASLFESIIILPSHIADFGPRRKKPVKEEQKSKDEKKREGGRLLNGLRNFYESTLRTGLRFRYLLMAGLLLVGLGAALIVPRIPIIYFPSEAQLYFVNMELPSGTPIEVTETVADRVDAILNDEEAFPELASVLTNVGIYLDYNYQPHIESHYAQCLVTVRESHERTRTVPELIEATRQRLASEQFGTAQLRVMEMNDGPPVGPPVSVRVKGDDPDDLVKLSRSVESELRTLSGVEDVESDHRLGKLQVQFDLDTEAATRHGLTVSDLARAVRNANDGLVATVYKDEANDEDIDVRVRFDRSFRRTARDLGEIRVRSRSGALIPIRDVATIDVTRGVSALHRHNERRTITLTANVDPAVTTSVEANRLLQQRFTDLPEGMELDFGGEFEETRRSFQSLFISFLVSVLTIYMILGVQFQSFFQPFLVLFTVPLSFIGVVIGNLVTGDPLTITSFIGLVGLAGVVVNDSIVLVDFINQKRGQPGPDGTVPSLFEVVVSSGRARMRAVLLTTVTTVFGVFPMAVGLGGRSLIWGPMATAIAFGLAFATFLTLFVIPAGYLIQEDTLRLWNRWFGCTEPEEEGQEPSETGHPTPEARPTARDVR